MWTSDRGGQDPARLRAELERVGQELLRLTNILAEGGDSSTLRAGIADREAKKAALASQLHDCGIGGSDLGALERHLPATLSQWRGVLRQPVDVPDAAAILKKLIDGKLVCSPAFNADGKGYYLITGEGTLRGALPHNLASPGGPRLMTHRNS
jgi:hypothetical protein